MTKKMIDISPVRSAPRINADNKNFGDENRFVKTGSESDRSV